MYSEKSINEVFLASCKKYANKPAVSNFGCCLTYKKLVKKSQNFTNFLHYDLKVNKGDRIALMLPNVLQYPVCFFGSLLAGMVVVNINPLYTAKELVKQLNDADVETIVVLANFTNTVKQALLETKIKHVIVTEVGDLCGVIKSRVINVAARKKFTKTIIPDAIKLPKVLRDGARYNNFQAEVNSNDLALLQYTGGTTGVSKGAMLTHGNLVANTEQIIAWIGNVMDRGNEVSLTVLPLYHIFSLTVCCLTFLRMGVFNVLITNPRNCNEIVRAFRKYKISLFAGLNSLFNALLNNAEFRKLNFKALKLTIAGGMAVQHAIAEKWQKLTGNAVLEGYGLTEASPVVSMNPLDHKEFNGSIGLPLPATQISIRDDAGDEVEIGNAGELCVKGPQVMLGYWRRETETKDVFWFDGWLRTGDIAVMDSKGFLYLVDRKKDIIVTSGYNVYPNEVEEVLVSHPDILEVAVIGVVSKHAGETVKAFVVRKNEQLTKEKIVAFCKENLASYKVPKRIEFREELPKSNVGKILRKVLRAEK